MNRDINLSTKRKINALAQRVGVKLNWNRAPGLQWNTKDVACEGQTASDIIHDIAHYAIASRQERKTADFGLGPGPDSMYDKSPKTLYGNRKCNNIEGKASALGIYWEKEIGLPWESTALHHAWDDPIELKRAWNKLKSIIKKYSK